MPIRRRITKPKEIPPPVKLNGAVFTVGHFNVLRNKETRRFYLFDARICYKVKRDWRPLSEGYDKIPQAIEAAKAAAVRAYL